MPTVTFFIHVEQHLENFLKNPMHCYTNLPGTLLDRTGRAARMSRLLTVHHAMTGRQTMRVRNESATLRSCNVHQEHLNVLVLIQLLILV